MKLSEQVYKRTIPGIQRVVRFFDASGCPVGDMIVDEGSDTGDRTAMVDIIDPVTIHRLTGCEGRDLLEHIVSGGVRTNEPNTILEAKARCKDALMRLDPATKRFLNPQTYPVGLERGLSDLRQRLVARELGE
jgi:nicotinate phosphoribosyltransferase